MPKSILEICAASVTSAINAQDGGADRVELCDNLYEGGTTPSFGMITEARKLLKIKLHILLRPRGGDFLYNSLEMDIIRQDILQCKNIGVDGIVVGFLHPDGRIDIDKTREIQDLATPLSVTFHRAFDMARDPFEALEGLKKTGVDRILTSGQQDNAILGKDLIKDLVKEAGKEVTIMAGAGLQEENILDFANYTMATEFHATLRSSINSKMEYRRKGIYMGGLKSIPEFEIPVCDPERVRHFRKKLDSLNKLSLQQ